MLSTLGFSWALLLAPASGPKLLRNSRLRLPLLTAFTFPWPWLVSSSLAELHPDLPILPKSPPPNSKRIGMNAVMKSFRFCWNSLSYITSFNLHLLGGPKLPDLLAYLAFCGMRASHRSLVGFVDQHNEFLRVACEELPFAEHRYMWCTPKGCDTLALCNNQFSSASQNACRELTDLGLPRVRNVQAFLYKMLCERVPDPFSGWSKLVKDRFSLRTEHYNAEVSFTNTDGKFSEFKPEMIDFKEHCSVLFTQSPSVRIRVIKTLVNSWSTPRRLHEHKIHKCLFCGDWEDDTPHYLSCSVLWNLILSSASMIEELLSAPP